MKKISSVLTMLALAAALFVGCAQAAPDLTLDDLDDPSWLVGTWETSIGDYDFSIDVEGGDETIRDAIKKAQEEKAEAQAKIIEQQKNAPKVKTVINDANLKEFSEGLKACVKASEEEVAVDSGVIKIYTNTSVKTNRNKTSITTTTDTKSVFTITGVTITLTTHTSQIVDKIE